MQNISSQRDLFNWLYDRVVKSEPQVVVAPGLLSLGEGLRFEISDMKFLARYDVECWRATFSDLIDSFGEPGKAKAGKKLMQFISELHAELLASPTLVLRIERINYIMLSVLGYHGRYVVWDNQHEKLRCRSTTRCSTLFGVRFNVSFGRTNENDPHGIFESFRFSAPIWEVFPVGFGRAIDKTKLP